MAVFQRTAGPLLGVLFVCIVVLLLGNDNVEHFGDVVRLFFNFTAHHPFARGTAAVVAVVIFCGFMKESDRKVEHLLWSLRSRPERIVETALTGAFMTPVAAPLGTVSALNAHNQFVDVGLEALREPPPPQPAQGGNNN